MVNRTCLIILTLMATLPAAAIPPQSWDEEKLLWLWGRTWEENEGKGWTSRNAANPYKLNECNRQDCYMLEDYQDNGRRNVLIYPIDITGMLIPYQSFKAFLQKDTLNPFQKFLRGLLPWENLVEFYTWAGLNEYPDDSQVGQNMKVLPAEKKQSIAMGASIIKRDIDRKSVEGLTFGCAACHSANLFGKKVLGLTNRFPRANHLFMYAKKLAPYVNESMYETVIGASAEEAKMYKKTVERMKYVGVREPVTLGLDTSTAQVGLSLAIRNQDSKASFPEEITDDIIERVQNHPLMTNPSESKPAVWWNTKYKTRYLSDGAMVSGNPVLATMLWNEIGRGTDLNVLDRWYTDNQKTIQEMTTFVVNTKPPQYLDTFPNKIYISIAKEGQKQFQAHCQKCHGTYEKAWDLKGSESLTLNERVKTIKVIYHSETPVKNVGTDPSRYLAMKHLAPMLNALDISRKFNVHFEPQEGYVPPPLEGIWARYPYFHNNSAANLCQVLTPSQNRAKYYWAGEAIDPKTDYDQRCVGYPLVAPTKWKEDKAYYFDSTKPGLSNSGHDIGIFLNKDGTEKMTAFQKISLIEFLKTL